MKAGVMFDPGKLEIFEKHLKAADIEYERIPGIHSGKIQMVAYPENLEVLAAVVKAANDEARRKRH